MEHWAGVQKSISLSAGNFGRRAGIWHYKKLYIGLHLYQLVYSIQNVYCFLMNIGPDCSYASSYPTENCLENGGSQPPTARVLVTSATEIRCRNFLSS
jgi:hypothetical protein